METSLALEFGVIPALVAIWRFDRMDAKRPEPPRLRRLVAIIAGAIAIPVGLGETPIMKLAPPEPYAHAAFLAFVVAGLMEETAKLLVVRVSVWRRPEFDERMDGIVYFARAGLGFALVENILYMLQARGSLGLVLLVGTMRALLSVPGHALFASMTGYFAARRRFDGKGIGTLGGLLIAIAMHGAFDFAVFCMPV